MKPRLVSAFVVVIGLAVLASACGSDAGSSSPVATPVAGSDVAITDPTGTTPAGTTPVIVVAPDVGSACPVGRWAFSNEQLAAFYEVVGAQNGVTFEVEGDVVFDLAEAGTFAYEFNDYALSAVIGSSTTRVALFGSIGGTYAVADSRIQTTNVDPQVTAEATVNGAVVDATAILQGVLAEFPFADAAFQCVGPNLEVEFGVPGSTAHVVLSPAP